MARATRDTKLETRTARTKLQANRYHWRGIRQGLAIGYRKGPKSSTWTVRLALAPGKYWTTTLGNVDDHQDANGIDVLDYYQAQEKAREVADSQAKGTLRPPYTIKEAMQDYMAWFTVNRKSVRDTELTISTHILPEFGDRVVSEITSREIRQWHERLATSPARTRSKAGGKQNTLEGREPRARKATANRILTVLKASLNHAWRDGRVESDDAWRRVRPFHNVEMPKVKHLTEAECIRLLNGCPKDFRPMVKAALLTGCRYGELATMKVDAYHPDSGTVAVLETKSGQPRHIPLTDEGKQFFDGQSAGRPAGDRLFQRADGQPWGKSHQNRPLKLACEAAGLDPVGFHILRHSYGSALAMRGVPLQVIAAALGHADTRITSRHYAHLLPSYVADTIRANLPSFVDEEASNLAKLNPKTGLGTRRTAISV